MLSSLTYLECQAGKPDLLKNPKHREPGGKRHKSSPQPMNLLGRHRLQTHLKFLIAFFRVVGVFGG